MLEEAYSDSPSTVHGMFDAVSPLINDLYTEAELRTWMRMHGFSNVIRTFDSRNIFIRGQLDQKNKTSTYSTPLVSSKPL